LHCSFSGSRTSAGREAQTVRARCAIVAVIAAAGSARADVHAAYAFALADSAGAVRAAWPSLAWDARFAELYVVDHTDGLVGIFSDNGMQVFAFGDEASLGSAYGVAPLPSGDLLVLAFTAGRWSVVRCNFRGEPRRTLRFAGAPDAFMDGFNPTAIAARDEKIYLADKSALRVLIADESGAVIAARDLAAQIQPDARKRSGVDARGFAVDASGDLLFTVPSLFRAYVVTPDGELRGFGTRGSSPGKFNVIAGIAADESGHLYVSDTLRAVVMVFDKTGRFLGEFGSRGDGPDELIAPSDLAVGGGRVFVTQSVGGVKVFDVVVN
jgi:hypothetical protein